MSVGANLKRERELRGITLEEIARETKIGVRLLGYIEDDRFDQLPSGIFRQSFVRSFARYLGIDEEKAVQEYLLAHDSENVTNYSPSVIGTEPVITSSPAEKRHLNGNQRRTVLACTLALLGALAIFYFVETRARTDQSEMNILGSRKAEQPPVNKASPVGSSSKTSGRLSHEGVLDHQGPPKVLGELAPEQPAEAATTVATEPLPGPQLNIKARQTIWVMVKVQGTTLFSGLVNSNETKSFSLQQPLSLRVSNPARVELSVGNQIFGKIGEAGKAKTIVVSAENYQRFLADTETVSPPLTSPN